MGAFFHLIKFQHQQQQHPKLDVSWTCINQFQLSTYIVEIYVLVWLRAFITIHMMFNLNSSIE